MSNVAEIHFETSYHRPTELDDVYRVQLHAVEEPVLAERVDLLPSDEFSRARARRFMAHVAMEDVYIDPCSEEAPNTSMLEAIRRANEGDEEAKASVRMNAHIAVVEAMIKSGHITKIDMTLNEQGNWLQHGQAMLHVHANALRTTIAQKHSGVMERTKAETVNGQRIEDLGRMGKLDDHYVFVPSLIPIEEEIPYDIAVNEVGFFGDTMTAAFQLTSTNGQEGHVESAFVAGTADKGTPRHDIDVLRKMYALAGYEADNWQPIDFLRTPLLIHKSNLPNGITDIVKLYDELAHEITGQELFFGQDSTVQSYEHFDTSCSLREEGLQGVTDKVLHELLLRGNNLNTPEDAIELLAELVGPLGVEHAITDTSIDPHVFGPEAASRIYEARNYYQSGNHELMEQALQSAIQLAVVTMCGMTKTTSQNGLELDSETKDTTSDEDCEFISKECPMCGAKNVKTVSTKHEIKGSCGCVLKK